MKIGKFNFDQTKVLSIAVTALGVVGTLLSSKVDANSRKAMKTELKDEIVKELLNKNN